MSLLATLMMAGMTSLAQPADYTAPDYDEPGNWLCRPGREDACSVNIDATVGLARQVDIPVIASGGVGTLDHLVEGVTRGHASAVLAASIFHFGDHTVAEAHAALRAAGLPARG